MLKFAALIVLSFVLQGTASAQLAPDFVLNAPTKTTVCSGESVGFNDLSEGSLVKWTWKFGDGKESNEQHPTHTYEKPGNYTVSLTVSNGSDQKTVVKKDLLTVLPHPQAAIGATTSRGRIPFEVNFSNYSTDANRFTWLLPEGESSNELNAAYTFETAGTYHVHLIARNDQGCSHTSTLVVQAEPTVCESFCLEPTQNPTREFIEFRYRLGPNQESGEVRLYSSTGQQINIVKVNGHQGIETLDVRSLQPGIYYFGLASGDRTSELQPVAIMP